MSPSHAHPVPEHRAGRAPGPSAAMATSPAPHLVGRVTRLTPSALERWLRCRRWWRNADLLQMPASDPVDTASLGLLVHRLLFLVHQEGDCADADLRADVCTRHGASRAAQALVASHASRCPARRNAEAVGHEQVVVRLNRPAPTVVVCARLDAVWQRGDIGVLEVRDYKTGPRAVGRVGDDPVGRLCAWAAAPLAARLGTRLRLRYEHLGLAPGDDPDPYEPDADDLAQVGEELVGTGRAMLDERAFAGVADPLTCRFCDYRSVCPDAATSPPAAWPETVGKAAAAGREAPEAGREAPETVGKAAAAGREAPEAREAPGAALRLP